MQILKTFIDGEGRRHKVGDPVPQTWDKPTLSHYLRHGMIGAPVKAKIAHSKPTKVRPAITKPAAPTETKPAAPTAPEDQVGSDGPDQTTGDLLADPASTSTPADAPPTTSE